MRMKERTDLEKVRKDRKSRINSTKKRERRRKRVGRRRMGREKIERAWINKNGDLSGLKTDKCLNDETSDQDRIWIWEEPTHHSKRILAIAIRKQQLPPSTRAPRAYWNRAFSTSVRPLVTCTVFHPLSIRRQSKLLI